jgi:predicted DNA-binding transcriptional regulator AlpA
MPTETKHYIDKRAHKVAAEISACGEPDNLLSTNDVADLCGMSIQFFEIGRVRGYGPRFVRLTPRRVRYRRSDVIAWLEERTHARTCEYQNPITGRRPGSKVVGGVGSGGAGGRVVPPDAA